MDTTIVQSGLELTARLSAIAAAGCVAGGVFAGIIRAVTSIEDQSIGFFCRFAAAIGTLYLGGAYFSSQILDFTRLLWQSARFYN